MYRRLQKSLILEEILGLLCALTDWRSSRWVGDSSFAGGEPPGPKLAVALEAIKPELTLSPI